MSPLRNALRGLGSPRALPSGGPTAEARTRAGILTALILITLSTAGCSVVHNGYTAMTSNGSWNDTVVVLRNRSLSAKAWHRRKQRFCREKHVKDFCNGFRAGYEATAAGADGCTPAFPPSDYWSWEYQSAEGQARTGAWFSGYPLGCQAAEEDGVSHWNQVPMSAGMQAEYQQAGLLEHEGALYPIPDPNAQQLPAPTPQPIMIPMADGSSIPLESLDIGEGERILPRSVNLPAMPPPIGGN